jgi:hypothetical protein
MEGMGNSVWIMRVALVVASIALALQRGKVPRRYESYEKWLTASEQEDMFKGGRGRYSEHSTSVTWRTQSKCAHLCAAVDEGLERKAIHLHVDVAAAGWAGREQFLTCKSNGHLKNRYAQAPVDTSGAGKGWDLKAAVATQAHAKLSGDYSLRQPGARAVGR